MSAFFARRCSHHKIGFQRLHIRAMALSKLAILIIKISGSLAAWPAIILADIVVFLGLHRNVAPEFSFKLLDQLQPKPLSARCRHSHLESPHCHTTAQAFFRFPVVFASELSPGEPLPCGASSSPDAQAAKERSIAKPKKSSDTLLLPFFVPPILN